MIMQVMSFAMGALLGAALIWLRQRPIKRAMMTTFGKLVQAVGDIAGTSEQVASMSRDLKQSSQEQLDTLVSTSSVSHEISSMIERTRSNAEALRSDASSLKTLTADGATTVTVMVSSSQDIQNSNVKFKEAMQKSTEQLRESLKVIQAIVEKTKVINEIVFQTKLLSFNASVEAARAGEHGKGFAVVAEEVGNLARMSGTAADEISQIVDKSVSSVRESIEFANSTVENLTEEIVRTSAAGLNNARECEKIFHEMSQKIQQTGVGVEEIFSAQKEQAHGVNELDKAISQLREVADRNRLVASQAFEQAEDFSGQTKSLESIVEECGVVGSFGAKARLQIQKFAWDDRLTLGVNAMDDEHKVLFGKINSLIETMQNKSSKQQIENAFNDLAAYTAEHFQHEERYMASIDYPQRHSHEKIHKKLLSQVAAFGQQLKDGKLQERKLISFLKNWLVSHIMGIDKQYAAHAHPQQTKLKSVA